MVKQLSENEPEQLGEDMTDSPSDDAFEEELAKLSRGNKLAKKFDETGERFINFLESSAEVMTEIERIQAYALAALKCIDEASGEDLPDSRKAAEKELRLSGLYYGPWIELVSREFSGEPMSDKEVADLNFAIAERFQQQVQGMRQIASESQRYVDFLEERGVPISVDDQLFITQLITLKGISDIRGHSYKEEALVQLHRTNRTDQAWFDLITLTLPD